MTGLAKATLRDLIRELVSRDVEAVLYIQLSGGLRLDYFPPALNGGGVAMLLLSRVGVYPSGVELGIVKRFIIAARGRTYFIPVTRHAQGARRVIRVAWES